MDRRGFLKALATTAAALGYAAVAPDSLKALTSSTAPPEVVEQATRKTLEWVTRQVARQVSHRIGPLHLVESSEINEQTRDMAGVLLNLIDTPMTHDDYEQRYVLPIAAALADRMQQDNARVCGRLPLPTGMDSGCVVTGNGLSLRGMQFYDPYTDSHRLRFDVLYG